MLARNAAQRAHARTVLDQDVDVVEAQDELHARELAELDRARELRAVRRRDLDRLERRVALLDRLDQALDALLCVVDLHGAQPWKTRQRELHVQATWHDRAIADAKLCRERRVVRNAAKRRRRRRR